MRLYKSVFRKISEIPSIWSRLKLFGQNFKRGLDRELTLIELQKQVEALTDIADKHNDTLLAFGKAIGELDQRTGGDSWGVAMQNAIAHLDNKFDAIAEAMGEQQSDLATLKKDWDKFWQQGVVESKEKVS